MADAVDHLLETLGYLGVVIGVAVEGEVVVLSATYLARQGLLSPLGIGVSAFIGSVATYNACFWLGRCQGQSILARRPAWAARVQHVRDHIGPHVVWLILGYRLLFGLRAATPFALGLSGVSPRRFLVFDTSAAAIWASGLVLLGLLFGRALERLASDAGSVLGWIVLGALAVTFAWLMRRGWRAYRLRRLPD